MNTLWNSVGVVASNWDIGNFLQNSATTLETWGGYIVVLLGVIMIIAGVYKLAKGLMGGDRAQTNWVTVALLILVGGAFIAGGWTFVRNIAEGGQKTIEDLGAGTTIIPIFKSYFK